MVTMYDGEQIIIIIVVADVFILVILTILLKYT
jgi:hypothetical protein